MPTSAALDRSDSTRVAHGHSPVALRVTTTIFTLTAFYGAAMLFLVEPMVAKLLLPLYGGAATVWSTSTLFFQVLLLLAYAYCHYSTRWLSASWQPRAHVALLLLALVSLPLTVPRDAAPGDGSPTIWLLRTLLLLVGLPFLVLGTTGPLLQRWYSWTGSPRAGDPYFLFAASNLGSFVGLLAYPMVVESHMTLAQQQTAWSWAYVGFLALTAGCGLLVLLNRSPLTIETSRVQGPGQHAAGVTGARMARWAALAFLPSTLMLGVTSHISTDVAAIPLLWVVPLSIYLGSFVLAFARRSREVPVLTSRVAVSTAVLATVVAFAGAALPLPVSVAVTLIMLAVVSYVAHVRLAVDRPAPQHLTGYYMTIAAGGALGGVLNGLVAPTVFPSVLEYRLALVLVPLLLIGLGTGRLTRVTRHLRVNWVRAMIARLAAITVVLSLTVALIASSGNIGLTAALLASLLIVCWLVTQHFSLALAATVALVGVNLTAERQGQLAESRTFYGTYRVLEADHQHKLIHGTTVHGTQFMASDMRAVPTTYYSRQGPLGDVFDVMNQRNLASVGGVGLGVGTVAAYGEPGQTMTFFEVDAEVVRIARDPSYFTYLSDSEATIEHVVGDGRLGMASQPDSRFELQILDAFSSDSIPVHLLTQEAVGEYLAKLSPGGMMVFHISNRIFDLAPVLRAASESLQLHAAIGTTEDSDNGATPSRWVAMSRDPVVITELGSKPDWRPLGDGKSVAWRDDYSSVLTVLR